MTPASALTRQEAQHTELLLSECTAEHLAGLADLLRFGVASSGSGSGACVAAAWLLNAARFAGLPAVTAYQRTDGTGFQHCDGDWLEAKAKLDHARPLAEQFHAALKAVGCRPILTRPSQLTGLRPSVLLFEGTIGLVLALNTRRRQLFCCELEAGRARLKWLSLDKLPKAELAGLERDTTSPVARADAQSRGRIVTYLDTPEGLRRLPEAEGLSNIAYASLHGHTQRDLSSCQVASLSSVALAKGTRRKVVGRAAALTESGTVDTQGTLRALAARHVERGGQQFEHRGLSINELGEVSKSIGLSVRVIEVSKRTMATLEQFRTTARGNLGRVIVNFARPVLEQPGAGHHSVVVAYHAASDTFLVDDPAGFKVPPFWVAADRLVEAMATFDATEGVKANRGYVVVERQADHDELSTSLTLRGPDPRR